MGGTSDDECLEDAYFVDSKTMTCSERILEPSYFRFSLPTNVHCLSKEGDIVALISNYREQRLNVVKISKDASKIEVFTRYRQTF
mmetsp:Transcript_24738/g.33094  ORF Transcript_24738/g.33094 Transcript_24738/m.33094 type:complete len:85 (+) Transcript_24738:568-822(+)